MTRTVRSPLNKEVRDQCCFVLSFMHRHFQIKANSALWLQLIFITIRRHKNFSPFVLTSLYFEASGQSNFEELKQKKVQVQACAPSWNSSTIRVLIEHEPSALLHNGQHDCKYMPIINQTASCARFYCVHLVKKYQKEDIFIHCLILNFPQLDSHFNYPTKTYFFTKA